MGESGVAASGSVGVFQVIRLFFGGMGFLPEFIYSVFSVSIRHSAAEGIGYIVLGDEVLYLRQLMQLRRIFSPGKIQFLQPLQKFCRAMITKTQNTVILLPCLIKSTVFSQDRFTLLRICERRRNTHRHVRVTAALVLVHDGENTGFPCFFAEIMREKEESVLEKLGISRDATFVSKNEDNE